MISFEVPGPVHGKGRPRFRATPLFVNSTGRVYKDAQTVSYENYIKTLCVAAMADAPPAAGPVWLSVDIHVCPPASTSKKRLAAMMLQQILPTTKPDLDNVAKLVMDCLNGVGWHDDKQIVALTVSRRYADASALYIQFREIL